MATLDARSVVGLARVAPSDGQIDGQMARGDEGDNVLLLRQLDTSDDERILRITEIKNRSGGRERRRERERERASGGSSNR